MTAVFRQSALSDANKRQARLTMTTDEEIDYLTQGNRYPGTLQGARNFARAIEQAATAPPEVWAQAPMQRTIIVQAEPDRLAATRLAITKAAAAIGEAMP